MNPNEDIICLIKQYDFTKYSVKSFCNKYKLDLKLVLKYLKFCKIDYKS